MSISTTMYVGYHLVCKTTTVAVKHAFKSCSGNPDHEFDVRMPFCPVCGSPIGSTMEVFRQDQTMGDIMTDSGAEWMERLTKSDIDYINKYCLCLDQFACDGPEGYDIVFIEGGYATIDGDNSGSTPIDVDVMLKHPPTVQIVTIQNIMQYSHVEVKFGAIVTHS